MTLPVIGNIALQAGTPSSVTLRIEYLKFYAGISGVSLSEYLGILVGGLWKDFYNQAQPFRIPFDPAALTPKIQLTLSAIYGGVPVVKTWYMYLTDNAVGSFDISASSGVINATDPEIVALKAAIASANAATASAAGAVTSANTAVANANTAISTANTVSSVATQAAQNAIASSVDFVYNTAAQLTAAAVVNGKRSYVLETGEYFEAVGGVQVSRGKFETSAAGDATRARVTALESLGTAPTLGGGTPPLAAAKLPFMIDFSQADTGSINYQQQFRVYGGTASVSAGLLEVNSKFDTTDPRHIQLEMPFAEGVARVRVARSSPNFILGLAHQQPGNQHYALWFDSAASSNLQFGWITGISASARTTTSTPALNIPASEDFWAEIVIPAPLIGQQVQIRVWPVSGLRPDIASWTYALTAGDPLLGEGTVSLSTTSSLAKLARLEIEQNLPIPGGYGATVSAAELFSAAPYTNTALAGQRGWQLYGSSAVITAGVLNLSAAFATDSRGATLNPGGRLRKLAVLVDRTTNEVLLGSARQSDGQYYGLFYNNTTLRLQLARLNGSTVTATLIENNAALTPSITENYWMEMEFPATLTVGSTIGIRTWAASASRPVSPQVSYTLTASDPLGNAGPLTLTTLSAGTSKVLSVPYDRDPALPAVYPPRITELSEAIGRWFPRIVDGKSTLVTITQGAELRTRVLSGTGLEGDFVLKGTLAPYLAISVDDSPWKRLAVTAGTLTLCSGLDPTTPHVVRVMASGINETDPVWNQGAGLLIQALRSVGAGSSLEKPVLKNKRILFIGDSITAGIRVAGMGGPVDSRAELSYPEVMARLLGAVAVRNAFGGAGLVVSGNGGVPSASVNVVNYMTGRPVYDSAPDMIYINYGTNDGNSSQSNAAVIAGYESLIAVLRSRYGRQTPIFVARPVNGAYGALIPRILQGKANTYYIDTTGWPITFTDGLHPDISGSRVLGERSARAIQDVLGSSWFNP